MVTKMMVLVTFGSAFATPNMEIFPEKPMETLLGIATEEMSNKPTTSLGLSDMLTLPTLANIQTLSTQLSEDKMTVDQSGLQLPTPNGVLFQGKPSVILAGTHMVERNTLPTTSLMSSLTKLISP